MYDISFPCIHKLVSRNSPASFCLCLPARPLQHQLISCTPWSRGCWYVWWAAPNPAVTFFDLRALMPNGQDLRSRYAVCSATERRNKASETQRIHLRILLARLITGCVNGGITFMSGPVYSSWGSVHTFQFPLTLRTPANTV